MRRTAALLTLAAALVSASSAAAALEPIRRSFGELTFPRVRAGTVTIPAGHGSGRTTFIVTLRLPPLAAAYSRSIAASGSARRLNVAAAGSRAYLAQVDAAQRRAVATLRRAIPEARVSRRFRIILDGFTLSLPVKRLPALVKLGFVKKVYPSLRYTLKLNDSPSVIGATQLETATGMRGDGVKIGIVDDGIDPTNPFFDPTGFSYPAGFPRGQLRFTTPKIIVARAYPGPNSGKAGRVALDRRASFHGTHVAGIAAGDAGTNAPAGADHPAVAGLSGIAPRAWLGNYRVFNAQTPIGNTAFSPQIVAAFEDAVADRMDVINFSGGGPAIDPLQDPLIEAVANVSAAGVVPVIAAGNDRDDFGLGSVGSPGNAPDAITAAAVSNAHFFAPALSITSAGGVAQFPFVPGGGGVPPAWASTDQTLIDVGSIVGTDGKPVERHLCGPPQNAEAPTSTLPPGSLAGSIALVARGFCTFASKGQRAKAAGAIGIVLVDNRPGEANSIPFAAVQMAVPGAMIADLDGARVLSTLAETYGRAPVRLGRQPVDFENRPSAVPMSFSSAGLTPFDHAVKPDVSAPGGAILSSTLPAFGGPFAVFDGTSMATPHVSGAAALLRQRHPTWSARQIKSALMSTAAPTWADTARTREAPVYLEGAGLVNLPVADDPRIFTEPQSLSFAHLNVNGGAASHALAVTVSDAGGGAGTWQVELQSQVGTAGAWIEVPSSIELGAGGSASLAVVARAAADAVPGDVFGFVVLRQGDVERRIPYGFSVTRPQLALPATPLRPLQTGDTRKGVNRASIYRWPTAPFGPAASYTGQPVNEDGGEHLYVVHVDEPVANFGVSVLVSSQGALIDPWVLGSADENDVQGYVGLPINVNTFMFDFRAPIGAAGAQFPRPKEYYVSVDSGHDEFSGRSFAGAYLLRAWVNDVDPPLAVMLTRKVSAGRPTLVARTLDLQSGVDPLSLVIAYRGVLLAAAAYDPVSGFAVFTLPPQAPRLKPGKTPAVFVASDFQETKNVDQVGTNILPNTTFARSRLTVVNRPTVTWLAPEPSACVQRRTPLVVVAGSPKKLRSATFFDGTRKIATAKRNAEGLFAATWRTAGAAKGRHTLRAVVRDASGAAAEAKRGVRVCAKKK